MKPKVTRCPACGFYNPYGVSFCYSCGAVIGAVPAFGEEGVSDTSTTKRRPYGAQASSPGMMDSDDETTRKMSAGGGLKVDDAISRGETQVQPLVEPPPEAPSALDREASSLTGPQVIRAIEMEDEEENIATQAMPRWEGDLTDVTVQLGDAEREVAREDFPEIEEVASLPGFDVLEDMPTQEMHTKPYKAVAGMFGDRGEDQPYGALRWREDPDPRPAVATRAAKPEFLSPVPLVRIKKKFEAIRNLPVDIWLRLVVGVFLAIFILLLVVYAVYLLHGGAAAGRREHGAGDEVTARAGLGGTVSGPGRRASALGSEVKLSPGRIKKGKVPASGRGFVPLGLSNPLLEKLPKQLHRSRVFFKYDRVEYGGAEFFVDRPARVFPSSVLGGAIKQETALVDVAVVVTGPASLGSFSLQLFDGVGGGHGPYEAGEKYVELPEEEGQYHVFWEKVPEVPEEQTLFLHHTFLMPEDWAANMILEIGHEDIEDFVWIQLEHREAAEAK